MVPEKISVLAVGMCMPTARDPARVQSVTHCERGICLWLGRRKLGTKTDHTEDFFQVLKYTPRLASYLPTAMYSALPTSGGPNTSE